MRSIATVDDVKHALWLTPRWGPAEWFGATAAETAALAAHWLRGEDYSAYLRAAWTPGELMGPELKTRLQALEAELEKVEELAIQRLHLYEREAERANSAETMLARASAQALDRLSELGLERERTAAALETVAELEFPGCGRRSPGGRSRKEHALASDIAAAPICWGSTSSTEAVARSTSATFS